MAVFGRVSASLCERGVEEIGLGAGSRWLGGAGCCGGDADLGQQAVLFGVERAVVGALTPQPAGQLLLKIGNAGTAAAAAAAVGCGRGL
jgi:hypothetical protein